MAKFLVKQAAALTARLELADNDLVLFVAASKKVCADSLGYLRKYFAKDLHLYDDNQYNFLWVVDWPLFEYDEGIQRWVSAHHPFTMPNEEDLELLDTDPHQAHADRKSVV